MSSTENAARNFDALSPDEQAKATNNLDPVARAAFTAAMAQHRRDRAEAVRQGKEPPPMPQWSDFITVNGSGAPTDNNQSGAAGNGATKMNVTACSSDDAGNTPANDVGGRGPAAGADHDTQPTVADFLSRIVPGLQVARATSTCTGHPPSIKGCPASRSRSCLRRCPLSTGPRRARISKTSTSAPRSRRKPKRSLMGNSERCAQPTRHGSSRPSGLTLTAIKSRRMATAGNLTASEPSYGFATWPKCRIRRRSSNSGNGLHVYWVSDKPLPVKEWRGYAEGLDALATQHSLFHDAVTTDAARVLRVPETLNKKQDPPKPVEIKLLEADISFAAKLGHLLEVKPAGAGAKKAAQAGLHASPELAQQRPAALAFGDDDDDDAIGAGIVKDYWFAKLTPEQKDAAIHYMLSGIAANTKVFELSDNGGNNDDYYRLITAIAVSDAPHAEDYFVEFASQVEAADPEETLREKFATCKRLANGDITPGTLIHYARQADVDLSQKVLAERGWVPIDPDLAAMNKEHAILPIGGQTCKTRVVTWGDDPDFPGRKTIVRAQSFSDFRDLHSNRRKTVVAKDEDGKSTTKKVPIGTWWLN